MTEFHIIGLGNLCEFVIKDIDNNRTHGVFSACDKHARESMQEFIDYVNKLSKENDVLHETVSSLDKCQKGQSSTINQLYKENQELKQQIGNLEHTRDFVGECCERLEKENEELKSEIREVGGAYEELWMRFYDC